MLVKRMDVYGFRLYCVSVEFQISRDRNSYMFLNKCILCAFVRYIDFLKCRLGQKFVLFYFKGSFKSKSRLFRNYEGNRCRCYIFWFIYYYYFKNCYSQKLECIVYRFMESY